MLRLREVGVVEERREDDRFVVIVDVVERDFAATLIPLDATAIRIKGLIGPLRMAWMGVAIHDTASRLHD